MTIASVVLFFGSDVLFTEPVRAQILLLLVGGLLAVLPDLDIVLLMIFRRGEGIEDHHASLLHRPLLVVPAVTAVAFFAGGVLWATIAALCLVWHYVHDTVDFGGGGIAFFHPISRRQWSPGKGFHEPRETEESYFHWLERVWLVAQGPLAQREVVIGSVFLVTALSLTSVGFLNGLSVGAIVAFFAFNLWRAYRQSKGIKKTLF